MNKPFILLVGAVAALSACNATKEVELVGPSSSATAFAGAGTAITQSQLNSFAPNFETISDAISDNTIATPTLAPVGNATLNGMVAFESGETVSSGLDEVFAIGSLTLVADITGGTITANASDFVEYDAQDPNNLVASSAVWGGLSGTLSGSGTASLSGLDTTLAGTITSGSNGSLAINSSLNGDFFDNSGDLIAVGDVLSSSNEEEGFFYVSE